MLSNNPMNEYRGKGTSVSPFECREWKAIEAVCTHTPPQTNTRTASVKHVHIPCSKNGRESELIAVHTELADRPEWRGGAYIGK